VKPHDTLFRTMCAHQDIQQDLVAVALPELAQHIRLETVSAVKDTFTEGAQADLLLSVEDADGATHLIYILVEHKSYPDRVVALQLWGYLHSIWKSWQQDPRNRRTPLPRIHPVVLYHGRRRWKVPTRLSGLHAPGGYTWADLEYRLVDLAVVEPREYRIGVRTLAFLIILKHTLRIMTREAARAVLHALSEPALDQSTRELLVEYMTRHTPRQNAPVLLETTREMHYLTEGGHTVMTMAEALLKEGEEKGHKKGLENGRDEGIRTVARNMLMEGAAPEFVQRTTGLTSEEIQALGADKAPGKEPQQEG